MEVVEHVVLFKTVQGASHTDIEAWASGLRALRTLQGVIHLHVGHLPSCRPNHGDWTHALYARYKDKDSLQAYAVHPDHISAVSRGTNLFSEVMAMDWVATMKPPISPTLAPVSSSPSWVAFVRWAPQASSQEVIFNLISTLGYSDQMAAFTFGPNFSPARARGFEWGFALFDNGDGDEEGKTKLTNAYDSFHLLMQRPEVEKFLLVEFSPMHGLAASM